MKLVSKGEILGFDDIVQKRPYTVSVRCISQNGTVFKIPKKTILEAMKSDVRVARQLRKITIENDFHTVSKIKERNKLKKIEQEANPFKLDKDKLHTTLTRNNSKQSTPKH